MRPAAVTPTLRPYQVRAIAEARQHVQAGRRRVCLVAPTGAGKTMLGAAIMAGAVKKEHRGGWFAHRLELREQAVAALERWGLEVGHSGMGAARPVQVVSVQGSVMRGECPDAHIVVFDECHHYASDEWGRLPESYPSDAIFIGLTATPDRGDGRALDHLFDALVVVAQPAELVAVWQTDNTQGLVPCEVIRPGRLLPAGHLAQRPVDAHLQHARGKRNVVFAPTVAAAETFAAEFRARGVDCAVVHGAMGADARRRALKRFLDGHVLVLINVFVLTEGWDCPATSVVTIARKMGSASMYLQATGRGARPAPGKDRFLVLDLAGISHLHGHPQEDRIYSLDGKGIRRAGESPGVTFCRVCAAPMQPGEACPICDRSWDEAKPLTITNDPLVKFARFQTDPEGVRAERLAKWIREARSTLKADGTPRNWRTALYRFKGTYGALPPAKIVSVALELAKGPAGNEQRRGW